MGILRMILAFLRAFFTSRTGLAAENVLLRQQLVVVHRSVPRPKICLMGPDRVMLDFAVVAGVAVCLDHVIVPNEDHLHRILAEHFTYYHEVRANLSLDRNSPTPRSVQSPENGKVVAKAYLGGMHHCYTRAAKRGHRLPHRFRRQEQSALKPRIRPSGKNRGIPSRSRSHLGASAELKIEPMRSRFSGG